MKDIRIVEEEHIHPVLFGKDIVSIVYRLVDWDTEESLSEKRFETLAKAEQAIQNILIPYWNRMLRGLDNNHRTERRSRTLPGIE